MRGIKVYFSRVEAYFMASLYHSPNFQDMISKNLYKGKTDKTNSHSEGELL